MSDMDYLLLFKRLGIIVMILSIIGLLIYAQSDAYKEKLAEGKLVESEEKLEVIEFDLFDRDVVYKDGDVIKDMKLSKSYNEIIESNETYLLKTTLNNGNVYYDLYVNLSD